MPCKECQKRIDKGRAFVVGEGPHPAKFLLVGEAPGQTENELERPFVGKTGQMLRRAIMDIGGTRLLKQVYLTNSVRVWPGPGNPTPPMGWIRECGKTDMVKTIEEVQPEVIICIGQSALKLFTDNGNIPLIKNRREVFHYRVNEDSDPIPVVATFHPSYIARVPEAYGWWMSDLYSYLMEESWRTKPFQVPFKRLDHVEPWFDPSGKFYYDIETTGYYPWEGDTLRTVGLAKGNQVPTVYTDELDVLTKGLLFDKRVTLVGGNIIFDLMFPLGDMEMPRCKAVDVMYLHYLLDERYPIRALKHLFKLYTNFEQYDPGDGGLHLEIPQLSEYNARDVVATRYVEQNIRKELSDSGVQYQKTEALMSRVIPILAAMTRTGIPVDKELLGKIADAERLKAEASAEGMRVIWERHMEEPWDVSILNRPHDLSDFLFENLGIKHPKGVPHMLRKDGKVRTNKAVLEAVMDQGLDHSGFVQALFDYRAVNENYKKYVLDVKKRVDDYNRVHPRYNIFAREEKTNEREGTVTGRLSIKRPAIHNIPKGHPMREAFVPLPGHTHLVQIDLSTIELVMLAQLSQDETLIHMVGNPDEDLHQWAADLCTRLGCPISRKTAKIVNFGILYGISMKGLAAQTPLSANDAARVMNAWYDKFPGVKHMREQAEYLALKRGWVSTAYGQRRNFPPGLSKFSAEGGRAARQAFNFLIQATANMLNLLILRDWVDMEGHEIAWPLTLIHDAILFSTADPEATLDLMGTYYYESLEQNLGELLGMPISLPIPAEAEVGPDWGHMEPVVDFTTRPE